MQETMARARAYADAAKAALKVMPDSDISARWRTSPTFAWNALTRLSGLAARLGARRCGVRHSNRSTDRFARAATLR